MANPFLIDTGGDQGVNQAFSGLAQALQYHQAKQEHEENLQNQMAYGRELQNMVDHGASPQDIAEFSLQNPEAQQSMLQNAMSAINMNTAQQQDAIKQNTFDLLNLPTNEERKSRLSELIQEGHVRGEDVRPYMSELGYIEQNPQSADKQLHAFASMSYPKEYQNWLAGTSKPKKHYEQGTGLMAGTSFDSDTGTYKIAPKAQQLVQERQMQKDSQDQLKRELSQDNNNKQRAETIYKDFAAKQKNYYKMQQAHENIESALEVGKKDPTGTSDIALLFQFNHLLDPTSVVRQEEFEQAKNSAGYADGVYNLVQQVKSGKLLTDQQRKSIEAISNDHMERADRMYSQDRKFSEARAKAMGIDPNMIFPKGVTEADAPGKTKRIKWGNL